MKDFKLSDDTYIRLTKLLDDEMEKGLRKQTHYSSTVRMYPTYVRSIPDGSGSFLILVYNFFFDRVGLAQSVACPPLAW